MRFYTPLWRPQLATYLVISLLLQGVQTALLQLLNVGRFNVGRSPVLFGLRYLVGLEVGLRKVKIPGGRRVVRDGLFEVGDGALVLALSQVDDTSGIKKIGQRPLEVDGAVDVFKSIFLVAAILERSSQARLFSDIQFGSPRSRARRYSFSAS